MARFLAFQLVFVHVKYTSNMAACYDNDVGDVTAPHVYRMKLSLTLIFWNIRMHFQFNAAGNSFTNIL